MEFDSDAVAFELGRCLAKSAAEGVGRAGVEVAGKLSPEIGEAAGPAGAGPSGEKGSEGGGRGVMLNGAANVRGGEAEGGGSGGGRIAVRLYADDRWNRLYRREFGRLLKREGE